MPRHEGVYIVKGKKGISYGIDYVHPQTGARIKKILKDVTSVEEAKNIRSIEIADAKRCKIEKLYGIKGKLHTVLFTDIIEVYLKWSRDNKKSYETDRHRAVPLQAAFNSKLMADINPFMIEKYKTQRLKAVKKATVNKELILGNNVYAKAIEWKKYNGENPFSSVKKFKVEKKKKPGALEPEQVILIMNEIKHPVKRAMVEFAFNTGWRIGEIRKLKKEDVDFTKGVAWILDPKNSETVEIELNNRALEIIKQQESKGVYVFSHLNGESFKSNLRAVIKNAASRAGISLPDRKAWHILRRTWASMMLQSGCDLETLRVLGNWKDFSMPMYYAEAANRDKKRDLLNGIPDLSRIETNGRNTEEKSKVVSITN